MMRLCMLILLVVSSAVGFVQAKSLTTEDRGRITVIIPSDDMLTCRSKRDCKVVRADCNFCCEVTAINAKYEDFFESEKEEVCQGNAPSMVCSCPSVKWDVDCIDEICAVVRGGQ